MFEAIIMAIVFFGLIFSGSLIGLFQTR